MKKYPLETEKKEIKYRLIKVYENFGLYESVIGGYKTCFGASDLGLIIGLGICKKRKSKNKNDDTTKLLF